MSKYWDDCKNSTEHRLKLTWEDYDNFIYWALSGIQKSARKLPVGIYGVPRGGLITAVTLSNRLNLPLLSAPCDNCLIVDDILDSGATLLPLYTRYVVYGNARMLVWHANVENLTGSEIDITDTIYYFEDSHGMWLSYPWE